MLLHEAIPNHLENMAETLLGTKALFELEKLITAFLKDRQMDGPWKLEIATSELKLRKIDEDIFYKIKAKDSKEEYVPTQDEIALSFDNNTIILRTDTK